MNRTLSVAVVVSVAALCTLFVVSPWGPLDDALWQSEREDEIEVLISFQPEDVPDAPRPSLTGLPEIVPGASRGPVIVTVRGAHGIPLDGVPVRLVTGRNLVEMKGKTFFNDEQEVVAGALTDAMGVVVFADVPYDGSHLVGVRAGMASIEHGGVLARLDDVVDVAGPETSAPIHLLEGEEAVMGGVSFAPTSNADSIVDFHAIVDGPEIDLRARVGLPFEARIVASDTGRRVPDAIWRAGLRFVGAYGGTSDSTGDWIAAELSQHMNVPMAIEPGRGYQLMGDPSLEAYFHPETKRVVAIVPVRPEVEVTVVPPPGVTLREQQGVDAVRCLGAPSRLARDGFGRLVTHGIPHFQGETVTVFAVAEDDTVYTGTVVMGRHPEPLVIQLVPVEPPPEPEPVDELDAVEPSDVDMEAASFAESELVDFDMDEEEWFTSSLFSTSSITGTNLDPKDWYTVERTLDEPSGNVLAQIYRPDGTPAAGVLANLDDHPDFLYAREDGRVLFQGYKPGDYLLSGLGAGAAFEIPVTVVAGETTHVTYRATWGGKIDLTVVDENGDPAPFARFDIGQPSGQFWTSVEDGVQRIDHFTDTRGKRLIQSVEIGKISVEVSFGTRAASMEIDVVDGQTTSLVLTLGPPVVHYAESFGESDVEEIIESPVPPMPVVVDEDDR